MKYLSVGCITVLLVLLNGCSGLSGSSVSPSRVQMTHSAYLGKKLGIFILGNGAPYHSKVLSNGSKVYAWNSKIPVRHPYLSSLDGAMDHFSDSECEIRIYTGADGRVSHIVALNDPGKDWDADACADYLK